MCECLQKWLPAYQKELLRRGLIRECIDLYQTIGNAPASAGYHSLGGCADLAQRSTDCLRVARNMGAAAWGRDDDPHDGQPDFFPHQHFALKGCPHAYYLAKGQIPSLESGHNGLAGNGLDDGPRSGVHWPLRTWEEGIKWAATLVGGIPAPPPTKVVTLQDSRIDEASWLALPPGPNPTYAYMGNDEDGPIFVVELSSGKTLDTFRLNYALKDPESGDVSPGGALWIADIGDNDANRSYCSLYVLHEPGTSITTGSLVAERYRFTYEGGPRNAEAFFIHPITGNRYIISKQAVGNLYRNDKGTLSQDTIGKFRKVGTGLPAYVTEAKFTPDGAWVVARQKDHNNTVIVLDGETFRFDGSFSVPPTIKGESIDTDGTSVWFGSEGVHSPLIRTPLPAKYRSA